MSVGAQTVINQLLRWLADYAERRIDDDAVFKRGEPLRLRDRFWLRLQQWCLESYRKRTGKDPEW